MLDFTKQILQKFGFKKYRAVLSTPDQKHPEKYMGSPRKWKSAEKALKQALENREITYREIPGEAVFYGPKIDLNIVDASGREWQCTTIQFDFNLPKKFNVCYVGSDNKKHQVIMIHRALLGAIERFYAILLEHYNGNLPAWLAPTQITVLPLNAENTQYAEKVHAELLALGIRSQLDMVTSSTIGYRIRQAETQKFPYMAICGKREESVGKVSLRKHGVGNIGTMSITETIRKIEET
jgi:threonyl-tRNA synthetase